MARAPVRRGHADVALALLGAQPLEGDDDGVTGGEALAGGRVDELRRLRAELLVGDAALDQRADLAEREQRVWSASTRSQKASRSSWSGQTTRTRLPASSACGRRGRGRAPHADVDGARRPLGLAGLARAIGRPAGSLVIRDLDAARGRGHAFTLAERGRKVPQAGPPRTPEAPRYRACGARCRVSGHSCSSSPAAPGPPGAADPPAGQPVVSFAGTHRLIDFPLSNCLNAGLGTSGSPSSTTRTRSPTTSRTAARGTSTDGRRADRAPPERGQRRRGGLPVRHGGGRCRKAPN